MEATKTALRHYTQVHDWLMANGLEVDPSKTELMTFTKEHPNKNLIRGKIHRVWYDDPTQGPNRVTIVTSL